MSLNECPKSYVTPESMALVRVMERAEYAQESAGAGLYGPNLSRWPARMVDALVVIEQERNRLQNAIADSQDQD